MLITEQIYLDLREKIHYISHDKFPPCLLFEVLLDILKMIGSIKKGGGIYAGRVMATSTSDRAGSLGLGRGLGRAGMSSYGIIKPSAELN